MKNTLSILAFSVAAAFSGASQAVVPTINGGTAAFSSGYDQSNVLDTSTALNANNVVTKWATDYASAGGANNTFLSFDFGVAQIFSSIMYTDRTSSGGLPSSYARGNYDYVTKYSYTFSLDGSFTDLPSSTTFISTLLTVPGTALSGPGSFGLPLSDFQHTDAISNVAARYVRWNVVSTIGSNPGAADFQFTTSPVPEPEVYSMMLAGLGVMGGFVIRRRRNRNS